MKATANVTIFDRELGKIARGETVEVTAAQAARLADLATIEGKSRGGRRKKADAADDAE